MDMNVDSKHLRDLSKYLSDCARGIGEDTNRLVGLVGNAGNSLAGKSYTKMQEVVRGVQESMFKSTDNLSKLATHLLTLATHVDDYLKCKYSGE